MFLKALDLLGTVVVTSMTIMVVVVGVAFLYHLYKRMKED